MEHSRQMQHFPPALQTWLATHKDVTVRGLAEDAGIEPTALSYFRSGKRSITFEALSKLLPAIEANSSRAAALSLHVAYLLDEIVAGYADSIEVKAVGEDGQPNVDCYTALASSWEAKSRHDPEFYAMWLGLDNYMHHPERKVIMFPQAENTESDLARVAEHASPYGLPTASATASDAPAPSSATSALDQATAAQIARLSKEPSLPESAPPRRAAQQHARTVED